MLLIVVSVITDTPAVTATTINPRSVDIIAVVLSILGSVLGLIIVVLIILLILVICVYRKFWNRDKNNVQTCSPSHSVKTTRL